MLIDKAMGGISSDDAHTNQYAAGTASDQTFSERKEIEQNRQQIAAYQHSKLGQNFAPHGEYVRAKPRQYKKPERQTSRQEFNANGAVPERASPVAPQSRQAANARPPTFREPPSRGYNPYS